MCQNFRSLATTKIGRKWISDSRNQLINKLIKKVFVEQPPLHRVCYLFSLLGPVLTYKTRATLLITDTKRYNSFPLQNPPFLKVSTIHCQNFSTIDVKVYGFLALTVKTWDYIKDSEKILSLILIT